MTTIVTILTDRYADWECALTMAAARAFYGLNVKTATPDGKPVTSAGGLTVTPDMSVAEIDPEALDILLVNGGSIWESEEAPDLSGLLQALNAKGKTIGAICGATLSLARAGLLDGISHTSNTPDFLKQVTAYKGSGHYVEGPRAIGNGNIVTAAGTAPITFMKAIMQRAGKGGAELDFYTGMYAAEHQAA